MGQPLNYLFKNDLAKVYGGEILLYLAITSPEAEDMQEA